MEKLKVGDSFKCRTHKRRGLPDTTWTGRVEKENKKSWGITLFDDNNPDNRWFPLLDKRTGKLR